MVPVAERREKDGRWWKIGRQSDIAWVHDGGTETPSNKITVLIPPVFAAYWTVDLPGTAEHPQDEQIAREIDRSVMAVLEANTSAHPWWFGYLQRGDRASLVFPDAPQVTLVNGGVVLIEAGPEQALRWSLDRDVWQDDGALPDVMFPDDRKWLTVTGWDDKWMSFGGSQALADAVLNHPTLKDYTYEVDPDGSDATPPGHDVWWHRK